MSHLFYVTKINDSKTEEECCFGFFFFPPSEHLAGLDT